MLSPGVSLFIAAAASCRFAANAASCGGEDFGRSSSGISGSRLVGFTCNSVSGGGSAAGAAADSGGEAGLDELTRLPESDAAEGDLDRIFLIGTVTRNSPD
jgi:hypothetical protein